MYLLSIWTWPLSRWSSHLHHLFLCDLPFYRLMVGQPTSRLLYLSSAQQASKDLVLSSVPVLGGELTVSKPTRLRTSVCWWGALTRQCCVRHFVHLSQGNSVLFWGALKGSRSQTRRVGSPFNSTEATLFRVQEFLSSRYFQKLYEECPVCIFHLLRISNGMVASSPVRFWEILYPDWKGCCYIKFSALLMPVNKCKDIGRGF